MRTVKWESDNGFTVEFGADAPFLFGELTDAMGASVQTNKAPDQDGITTVKVTRNGHMINLVGYVLPDPPEASALDKMIEHIKFAFDPKESGLLTYKISHKTIQIRCRPGAMPTPEYTLNNTAVIDVDLEADSDRWEAVDVQVVGMGYSKPMWVFPLVLPGVMGVRYGRAVIDNQTPYEISPVVEIFSTTTLVEILNETTGHKLAIRYPISEGQKMAVDIASKRAKLYQLVDDAYEYIKNVTNWVAIDSEWPVIVKGVNVISINKELPGQEPVSVIRYRIPSAGI